MNSYDRHIAGCIYCGRLGPYTDEHVVSAGLGGDDKEWMLSDCVCSNCNTVTFSKMESYFLKASPIGLSRLFLQPATRDGKPPSPLQVKSTLHHEESDQKFAGELQAGGQGAVFPSLMIQRVDAAQAGFNLIGPDLQEVSDFFAGLMQRLGDSVQIIDKLGPRDFIVVDAVWKDGKYVERSKISLPVPPKSGIWFEADGIDGRRKIGIDKWSIYRQNREIIGCADSVDQLLNLLAFTKQHSEEK